MRQSVSLFTAEGRWQILPEGQRRQHPLASAGFQWWFATANGIFFFFSFGRRFNRAAFCENTNLFRFHTAQWTAVTTTHRNVEALPCGFAYLLVWLGLEVLGSKVIWHQLSPLVHCPVDLQEDASAVGQMLDLLSHYCIISHQFYVLVVACWTVVNKYVNLYQVLGYKLSFHS